MKFRIIPILLALLLMLSAFTACQPANEPSDASSNSDISSDVPSSESSGGGDSSNVGDESVPDEPVIEEIDYFTANGQGELPSPSPMPECYLPTDTENLYSLEMEFPEAEGYSIFTKGDTLYLFYYKDEMDQCSVYSLTTGQFLCEFVCPLWGVRGILDNGSVYTADFSNHKINFWEKDGSVTSIEFAPDGELDPENAVITPDGRYMLMCYASGSDPKLYNLSDGTVTTPDVLKGEVIWNMDIYNGKILLEVPNDNLIVFDPETGTADKYTTNNVVGFFYGDIYSHLIDNVLILDTLAENDKTFYLELDYSEGLSDMGFGYAVTETYGDIRTYNFYNLRESCLVAQLEMPMESYGGYSDLLDNGRALIFDYSEAGVSAYIFDLPSAAENGIGTAVSSKLCSDEEIVAETDALAEEVYENYGVELLYASQGNDFVLYDYIGTAELNSYKVYKSVNTISEVLALYPENMIQESYEGLYKGMRFYLCGTLYGITDVSLVNAGAITTDLDGYIIIAFDINDSLKYNIPHELSHAFDRRINDTIANGGTDWLSIWNNATPVDVPYSNTYEDYEEFTRYTRWNEDDPEDIWFTDSYARTFPTEDRARIMEYLFNPEEEGISTMLDCDNLKYKARLYSYILRQCFDSCNTTEVHFWETYLGKIDATVLD